MKSLNGTALKIIAGVCMLIDHACIVFYSPDTAALLVRLTIGRVAMPVYVFLMCEGFFYTRSRRRYALSLLITALISEPFYDIALHGGLFNFNYQNVCFTLLTGFLMLCAVNALAVRKLSYILQALVIALFCVAAYFLRLSYDYSAMLTFAACYYLHFAPSFFKGTAAPASIAVLENSPGALLAAVPICLYNGKRGLKSPALKYFFYAFYPAHLLILYLISLSRLF